MSTFLAWYLTCGALGVAFSVFDHREKLQKEGASLLEEERVEDAIGWTLAALTVILIWGPAFVFIAMQWFRTGRNRE